MLIQSLLCVLSSVFFSQNTEHLGGMRRAAALNAAGREGEGGGAILFSIFVGAADKSLWLVTRDGNDAS